MSAEAIVVAAAPGRVNLMGDHTDHTGGLVLPMACDLRTVVEGRAGGDVVRLRTTWPGQAAEAVVPLRPSELVGLEPPWSRLVAAVVAEVQPDRGFEGTVTSDLPIGAGLSSSAALANAVALALGFAGSPLELAQLSRRAEQAATGVPCGIMDQLASAAGSAGHALRIDCTSLAVEPVALPEGLDVLVVHSGVERSLDATPYAALVADLTAAEVVVGPLREAAPDALAALTHDGQRRRARHVVTENGRVDALVAALRAEDREAISEVLAASHASLRDDLGVTVPEVDQLVADLSSQPGVLGARCTGAGFGGCVVALADAGTALPEGRRAWRLRPSDGATCAGGARPSWPGTPRR